MGLCFNYFAKSQWVTEGAPWRPFDPITLRDEAGVPISSTNMTSMLMTIYDLMTPAASIVNGVDGTVDVKNTRSCTLSTAGVFVLNLLSADTVILDSSHEYERRCALVQYQWAGGAKSDALEVRFVVRNVPKRP